jgi:hypothetical protein
VLRRRVRAQPRSEEHRDHVAVPVERRPMQRGVAVRVSREGVLRTKNRCNKRKSNQKNRVVMI